MASMNYLCQRWIRNDTGALAFSVHNSAEAAGRFSTTVSAWSPVGKLTVVALPVGLAYDVMQMNVDHVPFMSWPAAAGEATAAGVVSQPQQKTTEEKTMETKQTTQDVIKESFKTAAKLSAARATNKALAAIVLDKSGLSTKYPFLSSAKGRAAFETLVPMIIHLAATNLDLPKAKMVAGASEVAMTAAMVDGMGVVADDLVAMMMPLWDDIVKLFEKAPLGLEPGEGPIDSAKNVTPETVEA